MENRHSTGGERDGGRAVDFTAKGKTMVLLQRNRISSPGAGSVSDVNNNDAENKDKNEESGMTTNSNVDKMGNTQVEKEHESDGSDDETTNSPSSEDDDDDDDDDDGEATFSDFEYEELEDIADDDFADSKSTTSTSNHSSVPGNSDQDGPSLFQTADDYASQAFILNDGLTDDEAVAFLLQATLKEQEDKKCEEESEKEREKLEEHERYEKIEWLKEQAVKAVKNTGVKYQGDASDWQSAFEKQAWCNQTREYWVERNGEKGAEWWDSWDENPVGASDLGVKKDVAGGSAAGKMDKKETKGSGDEGESSATTYGSIDGSTSTNTRNEESEGSGQEAHNTTVTHEDTPVLNYYAELGGPSNDSD